MEGSIESGIHWTLLSSSTVKKLNREADLALKITTVPLNDNNYTVWVKSASLFLCGKSKFGYVTGKIERPKVTDPAYDAWETNDKIVMSWILNSMELAIAEGVLFFDSAKEIWDSLVEIYGEA